jgi:hypothetical protein
VRSYWLRPAADIDLKCSAWNCPFTFCGRLHDYQGECNATANCMESPGPSLPRRGDCKSVPSLYC